MANSTQDARLSNFMQPTKEALTGSQQKQWASSVVAKLTQSMKGKSINKILWDNNNKGSK